jgi:hypothetical protein
LKSRLYITLKKIHKWLGVSLAIFFVFFALSGIVLNHRAFFSKIDVGRNWLPREYRYSNWNNASVRGAESINSDSVLLYGNVGIWLTNNEFSHFKCFNSGFPKGIDNRKISDVLATPNGELFAATLFGLYRYSYSLSKWVETPLPINENRIVALHHLGDSLMVMSRSYILVAYGRDDYQNFSAIHVPAPENSENKVSLFKTIWFIHSGKIWGTTGKILVDLGGIAMLLLSITGIFYFFAPKFLRKISSTLNLKKRIKLINRWSYKWHLKVGIVLSVLLLLITATGMFLRPPLLIPIATKMVNPIKNTRLQSDNYWNDKFRDIVHDTQRNLFLVATSEGIYLFPTSFKYPPFKPTLQPPVSVMGINVFWLEDDASFAVGSFSGLYRWSPYQNLLTDYFSGAAASTTSGIRSPFGLQPIAGGFLLPNGQKVFFDYNQGAIKDAAQQNFPEMPREMISKSGMSLWNLALEFHTWRIIKFIVGNFYILVVPLAGILGIAIVLSGTFMWYIRHKKRKKRYQLHNQ